VALRRGDPPRALLTDGAAERLYEDVQAACPAARDPLVSG
jgi:hypothetical protein